MPARKHIGVEIGDTEFRFAELLADDDGPILANAKLIQTEYNFGSKLLHEAPYNRAIAKAFIRDLTTLFNAVPLQASTLSVAIPASSILVNTIPIDPQSAPSAKREQLAWECRTLYGYDTDVEVDVRSVVIGASESAEYHLAAAMPAQTNTFLRSVFQQLSFEVKDLDINHFVMENCLGYQVESSRKLTYAVIGLYEDFCSIGVYRRGAYHGYRQRTLTVDEGYFAQVLRLLQELLVEEPGAELEAVFTYGPVSTEFLLQSLKSLLKIPVKRYTPAAGMPFLSPQVREDVAAYAPDVFDISIGAALLGVQ